MCISLAPAAASTLSLTLFTHQQQQQLPVFSVTAKLWLVAPPLSPSGTLVGLKNETLGASAHLFPAVAVVSLQMPLDEGVRRARLALQEGAASLHAVLHHLQGVLIGCRADRQIHRQIKTNLSRQPKTVITLNSLQPRPELWQIIIPHSNYQRDAGTQ